MRYDQWEAQLPSLDPPLGEPLAPIETFEGPPAAEGVPSEPVPDASIPDPALTEPLPPLSTFDVRTPEATVETDDAEPAPVRYSVVVEGLDEIGLEDEFRDLSALEEADGDRKSTRLNSSH